jgi:hypothetical protein
MVDPSGDFMFESFAEIADERGITHKEPRTDEEWKEVRRHALVLLEAPILLTMEGRKVANPGEKSENPQVELQPEEIQKLIDSDRPSFVRRARRLQDAAVDGAKGNRLSKTEMPCFSPSKVSTTPARTVICTTGIRTTKGHRKPRRKRDGGRLTLQEYAPSSGPLGRQQDYFRGTERPSQRAVRMGMTRVSRSV